MRKLLLFLIALASIAFGVCSLASAQVPMTGAGRGTPSSGGGGSFSITPVGTIANSGSGSSTTLNSVTWGSGCNSVLVSFAWGTSNTGSTISAATLDGSQALTPVSASFGNNLANGNGAEWFYIANPTGTSGTPTVTFGAAINNGVGGQVYCVVTSTPVPSSSNGNETAPTGTSVSAPITIPSGGGAVGICFDLDTVAFGFTNLTLDNNINIRGQFGNLNVGSAHATGGTGASVSVTCQATGSIA
jgi:hypothetical protein